MNINKAKIVNEINDKPFFERPPKIKVFARQKKNGEYCSCHKEKGYDLPVESLP